MISPSVGARRELSGPVFHCRSEISTSRGSSCLQAATCPRHSPAHISVHKSLKHNRNCHSMFMRTERERDLASDRTSALGFDPPRQLSHVDGPWEFCTSPRLRMRTRQRAGRRIKRVTRRVVDVVYHYDLTASLRKQIYRAVSRYRAWRARSWPRQHWPCCCWPKCPSPTRRAPATISAAWPAKRQTMGAACPTL